MALIDNDLLWNKTEDLNLISEIGPNGTVSGAVQFLPGKFNNGAKADASGEYIQFLDTTGLLHDKGCIEFWLKNDTYSIADAKPSVGGSFGHFELKGSGANPFPKMAFFLSSAFGIVWDWWNAGGGVNQWFGSITGWDADLDDVKHILFVWNRDTIGVTLDTRRIYLDGVLIGNDTTAQNAANFVSPYSMFGNWLVLSNTFPSKSIIDNPKIYNDATEEIITLILNNRFNEGFAIPPGITPLREPVNPQVLLLGDSIDIYAKGHIDKLLNIVEYKTFSKDKLFSNNIKQVVRNNDNFYSIDNSKSFFNGANWRYGSYRVIDDQRVQIWNGIIRNIRRIHGTKLAEIESSDLLSKFRDRKLAYTSSDWETPARAFINICAQEGFTSVNSKAANDSDSIYTDAGVLIKCFFDEDDNITFQQAIEKLGEIGCADVYTHFGEIYFQVWKTFTGGVKVSITNFFKVPIVDSPETNIINNYRIYYSGDGGVPATDLNDTTPIGLLSRNKFGQKDLKEFDCSENQQIVMKDETTARYIGECYIRRVHKDLDTNPEALTQIIFDINSKSKDLIDLQTFIKVTLPDENWIDRIFEIFRFQFNSLENIISCIAFEVN